MTILSDLLGVFRERQLINDTVRDHSERIKVLMAETELMLRNEEEIMRHFEGKASQDRASNERRLEAIKSALDDLVSVDLGRVEQLLLELQRAEREGRH